MKSIIKGGKSFKSGYLNKAIFLRESLECMIWLFECFPLVCRYIHMKRQHFCWDHRCARTLGVYACTHNWKEAGIALSASAGAYQRLKEESFARAKMLCKTSLSNALSNFSGELNSTHRNLLYCSSNAYF